MNDPRISGRTLQKIRGTWLYDHPLCVHCLIVGRVSLAVELDHIVPLFKGGPDFDADDGKNRQGLCTACHDVKTRADMGWKAARDVTGLDGMPQGLSHHWNAARR
jgi:5-methylcytosine-specific restriction endonuclease McrA